MLSRSVFEIQASSMHCHQRGVNIYGVKYPRNEYGAEGFLSIRILMPRSECWIGPRVDMHPSTGKPGREVHPF